MLLWPNPDVAMWLADVAAYFSFDIAKILKKCYNIS